MQFAQARTLKKIYLILYKYLYKKHGTISTQFSRLYFVRYGAPYVLLLLFFFKYQKLRTPLASCVIMAAHFARGFGETDLLVWKKLFSNYQKVFGLFCDNYPKKKDLKQLDAWYVII